MALAGAFCLLGFENCSKVGFSPSEFNLGSFVVEGANLESVVANTKKNKPVTFSAGNLQGKKLGELSLGQTRGQKSLYTGNGTLQVVDAMAFTLKYIPDESYIGSDVVTVYTTDVYGNSIPGMVTVNVGNSLNSIQPALAVRGMSCITCHSSVSSNIVTDYGHGDPWYFDTSVGDSFYFDRLNAPVTTPNGLATLKLLNNSKIIVPKAVVPAAIQQQFSVTSLSQFIQARFAQGSSNSSSQVREVPALKIKIPSAARIQEIFNHPTAQQVYIRDLQNSPALQGLNYDSTRSLFVIKNLVCDGDLYLNGTVVFDNATVSSVSGCRIYAMGSIFIDGALKSSPYQGATNHNTQLLSARSIWMGTGKLNKNGSFCERNASGSPTGWYKKTTAESCHLPENANLPSCDTFYVRAGHILSHKTYSTAFPNDSSLRNLTNNPYYSSGAPATGLLAQERLNVEANLGRPLYDSSCGPNGRNVASERLMLVAPYVNNRNTGGFSGSTIAEAALMSLETFQFIFDPVFTRVSIFSMLDNGELISGDGI